MKVIVSDLGILGLHEKFKPIYAYLQYLLGSPVITSAYRPGDNGVHGTWPVRGLDVRCRSAGLGQALEDLINSRWQYDPKRPELKVAIYHDVGSGPHLHIQVHKNTKRRGGKK